MADDTKPKVDPVVAMMAIDDEQARGGRLPEAELNIDAPEDKPKQERDGEGKFKGKEPDDKAKDTVPLATFLEKQNKLKEQLDARDITIKQYEQRLAALEAKLNPPKEPDPAPDYVEDPKGYVDHQVKNALAGIAEANKKAEETGKKAQEQAAAATEQVQLQTFMRDLHAHEQRYVAANPDYYDALAHLRNVRALQLREFNPEITDAQIVQTIRGEETNLALQLARQGRDPVQTAHNLARHYGYQPKAKADADPNKPELKLPEVPNKRLPPDQTLGSGSSATEDDSAYKQGETDPVDVALASLRLKRA